MLALAGIAPAQVSNNTSLSGQYYFRQVLLITDGGTNVVDTRTGFGTLTFDGNGSFTINGQQLVGTAAPAALTGSGTYAVKSGGFTTLSNPLRAGATVNARLGVGALVGSSTEAGPTVFDLFLAIPVPSTPVSLATITGPYWISSLEFPNGGTANIRNTNFKLTANGAGGFTETTVTGQARNLGNALSNQTVSPMTYLVSANAGTLTFPLAAGQTNLTQLISGNKDIYISQDGSYFIGGSTAAGGHGMVVGVKAFANGATNASWTGFFYGAGMRFDADRSRLAAVAAGVNVTSSGAVWARRTRQSDGLFDAAVVLTYALGGDGSGIYQSTTGHVNVASTGQTFSTSGVDIGNSNSYELYFGARMPTQSGTGVFLDPQRVLNAANFAVGYPLSPGGFVALSGSGFGTQTVVSPPPYPVNPVAGVKVTVNGVSAPIYYLSPTFISAVVPYSVTGPTATVVVTVNGVLSNSVDVPLAPTAPGIYSWTANGLGEGIVAHALTAVKVEQSNPAKVGEYITIYLTGLGAVTPPVTEGVPAPFTPLSKANAWVNGPFSVYVEGLPCAGSSFFAGLVPTLGSVYFVNCQIPAVAPGLRGLAIQTLDGFTDMVSLYVAGP
jgi:uncharacterized protein (TIGR03437 family)